MNALPVARLFGFEIRVHVSWAIILAIITVSVVTQAGVLAPDASSELGWLIGAIIAAGFLLSALAHELGHALAARRAGLPGGPVVVYVFGGAAGPDLETERPRDEATIALAGPLVSLAIGLLCTGVFAVTYVLGEAAAAAATTIGRVAIVIGALNLLLGLINLLPAYPLDGGRVVRAIVWHRTGDSSQGLRAAATTGRWLGRLAAVVGFAVVLAVDAIDGLFIAAFGWFLITVAKAAERSATVDDLLDGTVVDDVMDRDTTGVPAGLTLDTFADQLLGAEAAGAVPVVQDHEFIGMLGARQVSRIRRAKWSTTRASDVAVSGESMPSVTPTTSLRHVLDLLQQHAVDALPVLVDGVFAGIVTKRAVAVLVRERARERGVGS
jgi:Zn-dependent protease/predicted transcriptional regulator